MKPLGYYDITTEEPGKELEESFGSCLEKLCKADPKNSSCRNAISLNRADFRGKKGFRNGSRPVREGKSSNAEFLS